MKLGKNWTTYALIGAGALAAYYFMTKHQEAKAMNTKYWYRERRIWRDSGLDDSQPYEHTDWSTGRLTTA